MTARPMPDTAEMRRQKVDEGSTAIWNISATKVGGGWRIRPSEKPSAGFLKGSGHYDVTSALVVYDLSADLLEDAAIYSVVNLSGSGTALTELTESTVTTVVPREYEWLNALIRAPEELCQRCLRLLGVISGTESAIDLMMETPEAGTAVLSRDADDQVMPVLGDNVTAADRGHAALATSHRREGVALRVAFEDDE
jgi:hypothetical protein